jgi:hypothetical protein
MVAACRLEEYVDIRWGSLAAAGVGTDSKPPSATTTTAPEPHIPTSAR